MITDTNEIQDLLSKRMGRYGRPSPYNQGSYAAIEFGDSALEQSVCAYPAESQSYSLWVAGFQDGETIDRTLLWCFPNEPYRKDHPIQGWDGL